MQQLLIENCTIFCLHFSLVMFWWLQQCSTQSTVVAMRCVQRARRPRPRATVDGRDRLQNTNVAQACAQHCIWGRPLLTTAARLKLIIVIRGGVRAAACRCPLPVCRAAVHVWSCRRCLTLANHFLGGGFQIGKVNYSDSHPTVRSVSVTMKWA